MMVKSVLAAGGANAAERISTGNMAYWLALSRFRQRRESAGRGLERECDTELQRVSSSLAAACAREVELVSSSCQAEVERVKQALREACAAEVASVREACNVGHEAGTRRTDSAHRVGGPAARLGAREGPRLGTKEPDSGHAREPESDRVGTVGSQLGRNSYLVQRG